MKKYNFWKSRVFFYQGLFFIYSIVTYQQLIYDRIENG